MNIAELEERIAKTTSPATKAVLQAELQKVKMQGLSAGGDDVAKMLLALKETIDVAKRNSTGGGGGVSKDEVETMLKEVLQKSKIRLEDLDDTLRASLTKSMKVSLNLTTPTSSGPAGTIDKKIYELPIFQKVLTDVAAQNNVYLYGPSGSGKSFLAEWLAKFLDYEFILLPCNQFTSPLEVMGGQTIDGYQLGKLERAWGNLDVAGNPSTYKGAVLCLDELPKIDPNTAGLLNDALSKVKFPDAPIENGKGDKIVKKNLVVIATGNVRLNETSTEYEANFKQDLSLQDRFVGSTYEVFYDYRNEYYNVMDRFGFIWLPLVKMREKIIEMRYSGQAFVSLRLLIALKQTYITYRNAKDLFGGALTQPKTLKQGVDSFLSLFKPDQIKILKDAMNYNDFMNQIASKDRIPLDKMDNNTNENTEAKRIIENYEARMAQRTV